MGRITTLDIPEEIFDKVKDAAGVRGMTPADWILDWLADELAPPHVLQTEVGHPQVDSGREPEHDDPFRELFGSVDRGDPHSSNNKHIEADLARQSGAVLGEQD